MVKQISLLLCMLLFASSAYATDQMPKRIKLHIEFFWRYQPAHLTTKNLFNNFGMAETIVVNPANTDYQIALDFSKMHNQKFPTTLALLVKVNHADAKTADLHFQLVEYGFAQPGKLWTQPRLILKKNETGEITTSDLKLKVSSTWIDVDCPIEDGIHCTNFVSDSSKKIGRFVKATLLSKHPISHKHCIMSESYSMMPQPAGTGWGVGQREFVYEQCLDATCEQSKHLGKEVFTITKNGERFVSIPHISTIRLIEGYGEACEV